MKNSVMAVLLAGALLFPANGATWAAGRAVDPVPVWGKEATTRAIR